MVPLSICAEILLYDKSRGCVYVVVRELPIEFVISDTSNCTVGASSESVLSEVPWSLCISAIMMSSKNDWGGILDDG